MPEHRSILRACGMDTRSVAEVAAHLAAATRALFRVLIGDMAGMGLVVIHSSGDGRR